jgi:hypothetical protein
MSGPKVVRIVTREELIAQGQGQLARLDAVLAAWAAQGRRHDVLGEDDITAAERRREDLQDLLGQDRFAELQTAVAGEIAFLKSDQEARLHKAALAAAKARTAQRREADAAAALLASLRRSGKVLPAGLEAELSAAAEGWTPAAKALSAGFAVLSAPDEADRARLGALARSLKTEEGDRSLQAWLERQAPLKDDGPLAQVEARLAELGTLSGAAAAAPFEERLQALRAGTAAERRGLLIDSLSLDVGKALAAARARTELLAKLDMAFRELSAVEPETELTLSPAEADEGLPVLTARLDTVEAAIARARAGLAAAARRHAVLQGLVSLGYEVGAELSTAWVQEGRVVLRKSDQPGYGVELGGGAIGDRVQMRVVAFEDAAADAARDRDAETTWCRDVATLQEKLGAAGGQLIIDRATPVGAGPVKRVQGVAAAADSAAREGPATRARTLQ